MYISTRGNSAPVTASQAILQGMVPEGGLFVSDTIPQLSIDEVKEIVSGSYQDAAKKVFSYFLNDYSAEQIAECVEKAYNAERFDSEKIAPLHSLSDDAHILELWHGPTLAFKDVALQIMPHFLVKAIEKSGQEQDVVILVATSGDTGKAALEGFKNVEGVQIIVLYPHGKVSEIQKLQMVTTNGNNTHVVAVEGNFDDCQTAVKNIFTDDSFNEKISELGYVFSSANSINWGRLLPQVVYYFTSYGELVKKGKIQFGDQVNFVVPTGNFGNILAAYYAYRMGLPVNKLICASNDNNVLTDFFESGIYNRNRNFIQTITPSMDILISSNLERFLFEMNGHNGELISEWMKQLQQQGSFDIGADLKEKIEGILYAGFANEEQTKQTIGQIYNESEYVLDPHTAVAVKVYQDYVQKTQDHTVTVIDATASPYKFNATVLEAIKGSDALENQNEFAISETIEKMSGMPIPASFKELKTLPELHDRVTEIKELKEVIVDILGSVTK